MTDTQPEDDTEDRATSRALWRRDDPAGDTDETEEPDDHTQRPGDHVPREGNNPSALPPDDARETVRALFDN